MKTTNTTLTENEVKVIKAYKADCYVADYGWDSPEAAAWTRHFHKDCGLAPRVFAGTLLRETRPGLSLNNARLHQTSEAQHNEKG